MFRGVARLNLDGKGRLSVPARHRDTLAARCNGQLVVTADPSSCLLVYPQNDWEPIQQRLMSLSGFDAKLRSLQRLLVGYAEDVELDGAGRILISEPLREFAGLDKRVVLVGQGNKFELWDDDQWNLQRDAALTFRDSGLPPELEGFSL